MMRMRHLLPAGLLLLAALGVRAAEVQVAVAANFLVPAQKIAAGFQQATGHTARLSFGSTGRFYSQVRHGAPYQVLLSADAQTPARLVAEGRAVSGSQFTYALGRLVLWSATPQKSDDGVSLLRSGRFDRLAIADPKLAPYGVAALQVLQHLGLEAALAHKIVQGESIAQAYQFVATGNAPLGLVAWSQVQRDGRVAQGWGWLVPQELHGPIRQDAVLLARGAGHAAAAAFLDYLRSEPARAIVRAHGYGL